VKIKALITLKKAIKMMLLTNEAYLNVCKLDTIAGSEECVCLNLISYVSNFDSVVRIFGHYKNHFQ